MKEYIRQFYYEGIGDLFYIKPKELIDLIIKNKIVNKIFTIILKIMYIIFAITCAVELFKISYPFI